VPCHSHSRSCLRATLNLVAVLIVASAARASAPNESHGVRLVLAAEEISPTSTFELRFDQAMVPAQSVGLVAPNSPLVITPALPGSFVWLSQRSGVFTPNEPLALATTYQLRLTANLRDAEGQPSEAKLDVQVQTPPMSITGVSPSSFRKKDAPSSPKIVAQFNVRVKAETLARFIEFRDASGHSVGALTAPATVQDGYFEGPASAQKAWRDRFKKSPNESASNDSLGEEDRPSPAPNRVIIRSAQPLSASDAWAARSAGSALKPFTYLLAFENGATPASVVADVPVTFATPTGIYRPEN
jgi:alpha-2-macroglobulin